MKAADITLMGRAERLNFVKCLPRGFHTCLGFKWSRRKYLQLEIWLFFFRLQKNDGVFSMALQNLVHFTVNCPRLILPACHLFYADSHCGLLPPLEMTTVADVLVGDVGRSSSMFANPQKRSPAVRENRTWVRRVRRRGVTTELRHGIKNPLLT